MRHRIGLLATAAATGAIAFSLVSTGTLPPASAARAAEEHSLAADGLQVSSAIQQLNDPASEQNAASPQAASAVAQSQARAQALLAAAQQEAAAAQSAAAAAAAAQSTAAQSVAPAPAAPAAPAAPTADSGTAGPDAYRSYARGKVGSAQFSCLDALWTKESGWRPSAKNPGSTAYGIPQLLNATWAATGIARTSNGYRQVDAGLIYIEAAYGTPCAAWSHSKRTGWY